MGHQFKAMVVRETDDGKFVKSIETVESGFAPQKQLTIETKFSSLNYKDALSSSGNKGITKRYPHIPGIDCAGVVVRSESPEFKVGDEVIVTGYDLGMNTFGGFSEYVEADAEFVVPCPEYLTLENAMKWGTSGFTAAIGVSEIQKIISPKDGKVLVTGATGAVGSCAVAILSKLGYEVIASTGKDSEAERLRKLGAKEIINRKELEDVPQKALFSKRWAAAFDTVGGPSLAYILKCTADHGIVTNCGMIGSNKLDVSIMPFIIRGVRLVGIAAADTPMKLRKEIWNKLGHEYRIDFPDDFCEVVSLEELPEKIDSMLKGELKRKIMVKF